MKLVNSGKHGEQRQKLSSSSREREMNEMEALEPIRNRWRSKAASEIWRGRQSDRDVRESGRRLEGDYT